MDELKLQVLNAIKQNANTSGRLRLADLRKTLPGIERHVLDSILFQLQDEDLAVLYRNDNTRELKADDHEAAIDVNGYPRHLVYLDQPRPPRRNRRTS